MDEKIQNRVNKIQRLKEVGAPRWILRLEGLTLLHQLGVLDDNEFDKLVEEQVTRPARSLLSERVRTRSTETIGTSGLRWWSQWRAK